MKGYMPKDKGEWRFLGVWRSGLVGLRWRCFGKWKGMEVLREREEQRQEWREEEKEVVVVVVVMCWVGGGLEQLRMMGREDIGDEWRVGGWIWVERGRSKIRL